MRSAVRARTSAGSLHRARQPAAIELRVFRVRRDLLKGGRLLRVKRIGPRRVLRFVAPVFIHPKPRRGISPNDWFEGVPASLRDLLMARIVRALDPPLRDSAI